MRKINPPLESKQRLTRDNCHEKNKRNHPLFPHLVSRPNDNRGQKQAGQTNGTTRNNQKVESKGGAG